MRRPSRRLAHLAALAVIPLSLVGTGVAVTTSSYSVFSDTTANASDAWSTGSITLADDDSGTAMFSASGLKPGSTGAKCIAVTSTGSLPSVVKLYGTSYATTHALGSDIDLTITQGTGGSFADCSAFTPLPSGSTVFTGSLATFAGSTSFGSGLPASGAWAPTGGSAETRVYKIEYTIDPSTPNSAQGGTATLGFTWEADNS